MLFRHFRNYGTACERQNQLRSIFESLIVFSVMTGLLLPARLLFVEYVSDDWLGSLGIISAISISVIFLARKQKLGFFGPMLERQVYRFQRGKRGLIIFGESVFLLLILGTMIFAIDQGNSMISDIKVTNVPSSASGSEEILKYANQMEFSEWLHSFLMVPVAFLTTFPQMSVAIATIDQRLDGWLMHFYTVGFVEYLELLGILIFYRFSFRKKQVLLQSSLYSKTPV